MKPTKTIHIALGSNKGNKLQYLQSAIDAIFVHIGAVKKISKVYKTPAFGFEGDDFYNACISVVTEFKPKKVLRELQAIEVELGRKSKISKGYESREIDLDILFFEDEIIEEKTLILPHPQLQNRKFVLQPLLDVAKDLKHPVLNKSIETLLVECNDSSVIEHVNIWLKNPKKSYTFNSYNYIAIEGNIGAGKTSLSNKISSDFNAKLILERFADNPFLPKFYQDAQRYAFTL
uniref:2-amino-4-hydroxy-6- hydroxymethyldihydropteridine diphosphokinase n=1 Tax=uncultured Winogradskyella sp. TaxID=395353 RepID=UPI0030ECFED8